MGVVVGWVLLGLCLWLVGIVVVVLLMRLSTVAVQGGRGIWVILLNLESVPMNRVSLRNNDRGHTTEL